MYRIIQHSDVIFPFSSRYWYGRFLRFVGCLAKNRLEAERRGSPGRDICWGRRFCDHHFPDQLHQLLDRRHHPFPFRPHLLHLHSDRGPLHLHLPGDILWRMHGHFRNSREEEIARHVLCAHDAEIARQSVHFFFIYGEYNKSLPSFEEFYLLFRAYQWAQFRLNFVTFLNTLIKGTGGGVTSMHYRLDFLVWSVPFRQ